MNDFQIRTFVAVASDVRQNTVLGLESQKLNEDETQ